MTPAVVWLRRNLRLDDNAALGVALRHADAVVPVYVFERGLPGDDSPLPRAVLAASIRELAAALRDRGSRLVIRKGPPADALVALCRETGADTVVTHRDHEPQAKANEAEARASLEAAGARFHLVEDLHLVPAGSLETETGRPFTVFTPFARRWLERDKEPPLPEPGEIPTPAAVLVPAFPSIPLSTLPGFRDTAAPESPKGGAREARLLWDAFRAGALERYAGERDQPDLPGTSRLSPHLRFGTIGVRRLLSEARAAFRETDAAGKRSIEAFVKELAWREFYASLLESFPGAATKNFRPEFDRFPWVTGEEESRRLSAWAEGRTGYPIVDAGMRQLVREGWMHNRARMIVASFLTKDLLVDWRRGEAFFRRHLADGDVASNSGGWQWAAGSGTDAQPFFRIFNPVLQGRKFDPEGTFVRRFVPELSAVAGVAVHESWNLADPPRDYPAPVVDHAAARERALAAFATLRR